VINVATQARMALGEAGELYSPRWQALLKGQSATST